MNKLLSIFLILTSFIVNGQDKNLPKEVNLVFDYLLNEENKDYPEIFGDQSFQLRPLDYQIIDIDDDGITEVFLQTYPRYRQSPSITIFQIDKKENVTRIIEGFAPGRLEKLSKEDDYLDSHTTGLALDILLELNELDKRQYGELLSIEKYGVVLYKNFIHVDERQGKGTLIDLTYLDDYSSEDTCENFQFSKPDKIIAGNILNQDKKYFIAKVDKELYCYKIYGFKDLKFVDKEIEIIAVPKDFKEFHLDNMTIKYLNKKGQIIDLEI